MITIKEAIIVEGKYDKQKILSFADALVIETTGFDIFKNEDTKSYIAKAAIERGIVILTDSDSAGFKIRNHIKSFVPEGRIKNAYIPEIEGKERRKSKPSKEGTMGVEGMDKELLIEALKASGCTINGEALEEDLQISRLMLYEDGFIGGENSAQMRKKLCEFAGLPSKISVNSLIKALNSVCGIEKYREFTESQAKSRK